MVGRWRGFALATGASALLLVATAGGADASLVQADPFIVDLSGTGFGNVTSILAVQDASGDSDNIDEGAVTFDNPTGTGPDVISGAPHTQLVSAGTLGVTDASQLVILFNGNETGGGLSVDITDLVLTIYNADGSVQFTSGAFGATTGDIADITQGTGQSAFAFVLDATQAAAAGALASTDLIGLSTTIANVDDGPENFFVANQTGGAVPEPGTLVLLGSGLAAIAAYGKKRARR